MLNEKNNRSSSVGDLLIKEDIVFAINTFGFKEIRGSLVEVLNKDNKSLKTRKHK